ncbi:MAG TPA: DUF4870 domain-containing protein [Blastocatellia bacterium]|jgi:uncharacterized membrane protein|nr:DUF4870 domain-containing protein [Blastocatellia bacterium]
MSDQPPYGYPQGGYQGGGYPPPSPPTGKTKTLGLEYNVAAMLCYLPSCLCCINLIFAIIWLATEPKDNRFLRFHAMQGLMLFAIALVIGIIFNVLGVGVSFGAYVGTGGSEVVAHSAGMLVNLISSLVSLALLIAHIIAIIKALQGQIWKIPVIGDLAEKNI